jgi:hypothetical protein
MYPCACPKPVSSRRDDEVPEVAFSDSRTLCNYKVGLPSWVKKIGRVAIDCSSGVIELKLLGLVEICSFAFRGCTGISELTLHDALVEIGKSAFHDCRGLRKLTRPHVSNENLEVIQTLRPAAVDRTVASPPGALKIADLSRICGRHLSKHIPE